MKKAIFASVIILALILGLFSGPYYSAWRIKNAWDDKDFVTLVKYVDFPAVRENMKKMLHEKFLLSLSQESKENKVAFVTSGLASMLGDSIVDEYITEENFSKFVEKVLLANKLIELGTGEEDVISAELGFNGMNQFSINIYGDKNINLILSRGFPTWKVTEISFSGLDF